MEPLGEGLGPVTSWRGAPGDLGNPERVMPVRLFLGDPLLVSMVAPETTGGEGLPGPWGSRGNRQPPYMHAAEGRKPLVEAACGAAPTAEPAGKGRTLEAVER